MKTTKEQERILMVTKRIRDSFSESVATYTHGRCYHFACILREIFGGELYFTSDRGHIIAKIGGKFYDIRGDVEYLYTTESPKDWKRMTKFDELNWDSNYGSGSVSMFLKKYNNDA